MKYSQIFTLPKPPTLGLNASLDSTLIPLGPLSPLSLPLTRDVTPLTDKRLEKV